MSRNKNPEADLESKRGLFFQIGLSATLAIALLVINYETPRPQKEDSTTRISGLELHEISMDPRDSASIPKPPEAQMQKMQKNID